MLEEVGAADAAVANVNYFRALSGGWIRDLAEFHPPRTGEGNSFQRTLLPGVLASPGS